MICTGTVSSRPSQVPVMTLNVTVTSAQSSCKVLYLYLATPVCIPPPLYFPHLYVKHLSLTSV